MNLALDSIRKELANTKRMASQSQLKEIAILTSLAKELCDKGYRNPTSGDERLTKEIKDELAMYQKVADRIKDLEKSVRTGQQLSELDGTLVERLRELFAKKQTEYLLGTFEALFPQAAEIIRIHPPAMQLVQEAAIEGADFGGHAEDGPSRNDWPYMIGKKAYVPKAQTDPIEAMRSFLFECHNCIYDSKFKELEDKADFRKITTKEYAYEKGQLEVKAEMRMAEIWTQMKPQMKETSEKPTDLDRYDDKFHSASLYGVNFGNKLLISW